LHMRGFDGLAPALAASIQAARQSKQRLRARPRWPLVSRFNAGSGSTAGRVMPNGGQVLWIDSGDLGGGPGTEAEVEAMREKSDDADASARCQQISSR